MVTQVEQFSRYPQRSNPETFYDDGDIFISELPSRVAGMNTQTLENNDFSNNCDAKSISASNSANLSAQSALIAQASANFQGAWSASRVVNGITLNGYTAGQSTMGSNGVIYMCTVTHTVAKDPVSTSGYWVVNVPLGAIGNITSPLLDLNLMTAKTAQQYQGEFRFERSTGAGYVNSFGKYIWDDAYSGIATGGSLLSLDKTGAGWVAGALVDYVLKVTTGGVTEYRWVIGNTATSVSLNKPLSTPVTSSSTYLLSKPRFNENGYVNEGARTNLASYSADLTNAVWVKTGGSALKDATGMDGVTNSASTFTATSSNAKVLQSITSALAERTYSVAIKRKTGVGKVYITQNGGSDTWTEITNFINSSTYTLIVNNKTVTNPSFGVKIETSGDAIYIDANQLETTPFATRYIPNNTAGTMTQNADVLSISPSDTLGLHSSDITISCDWISDGVVPTQYPKSVFIIAGTDSIQLLSGNNGNSEAYVYKNPTGSATFPVVAGTKYRQSASFNATNGWVYKDGVLVETKSYPSSSSKLIWFYIGSQYGTMHFHHGNIQRVRVWNKVLAATEHGLH